MYRAVLPMGQDSGEEQRRVATAEDVDALIAWLSDDDVYTVTLEDGEDDPALAVQVHGEYGYLLHAGELLTYSVGDPESPALAKGSDTGFPEGSGVALDTFREALIEFIEQGGKRPHSPQWREAELD